MDLNALIDFTLVATNEGLGKASRASGISKATLSRRISDLEEQLGVRLIERSARGLKLTEAGEMLMARTEGPMHEVAEAMTAAREGLSAPRGRLRVASPVLFSQLAMGRIAPSSVRPTRRSQSRWWRRIAWSTSSRNNSTSPFGSIRARTAAWSADASPRTGWLSWPRPQCPCQCPARSDRFPASWFSSFQAHHWKLEDGRLVLEPIPKLRLSSFLMIRDAAIAGAGAALIPQSIAWNQLTRGELVQWGTVSGVEVELWVLHTSRRLPAPKVRAFVEFMCAKYPDMSLVLKG